MMLAAPAILIAIIFLHATDAWSQDLPPGWRMPTVKEITDPIRKDQPGAFAKVTADFNGDSVTDEALLLKSTRFGGEGLWIRLSQPEGKFAWLKLAEINWGKEYPSVDLAMGIDVVLPGVHSYGCFDGAKDCNFGPHKDRPKLNLRDPSLMYFQPEGAASLFFWSRTHNKFMRVWLSD